MALSASLILRFTLVAAVALALQYLGIVPPLPGLGLILPRLGGSGAGAGGGPGGTPTINVDKLLADLNSDLPSAQPITAGSSGGAGSGSGSGGDSGGGDGAGGAAEAALDGVEAQRRAHHRAASAALSLMYLAAAPPLRDQAKRAPGVMQSLLRHVLTTDLAAAAHEHRQLTHEQQLQQHRRRQQQQHHHGQRSPQQQHQQPHVGADDDPAGGPELLPACVLAVARLAAGDEALQAALLGGGGGVGGGFGGGGLGRGGKALREGQLLSRLEQIMQSGVPSWQAAAAVLLHTLAGEALGQHRVGAWAAQRAETLIDVGMGLVETGASFNSSDAVQAGTELLELVAADAGGRAKLADSGAPAVVYQVIVTYAGTNTSSHVVGGAVRLLRQLIAGRHGGSGGGGGGLDGGGDAATAGLVAPLVREVRLGQRPSLAPCLALLAELVRAGAGAGGGGGGGGSEEGAGGDAVGREAVGAGLLSLCAQLLFQTGADKDARLHCSFIAKHTVSRRRAAQPPQPPQEPHPNPNLNARPRSPPRRAPRGELAEAGAPERRRGGPGVGGDPSGDGGGADADVEEDVRPGEPYADSAGGRAGLAADLMRIMRETEFPDLHNAVLEACRDVAPARLAAEALVGAGVVPHMVAILAYNTTQGYELGLDGADTAWVLQSQRSAAAVIALLALQPRLRPQVVADGALLGLGLALRTHSGQPGLMAQVRTTAAAALVPLLGEDGRFSEAAVTAGVLEPMVKMYYSRNEQERQIATRVLRLLGRETAVAAMYDRAGIKV